jgi:hypothetical protein
MKYEETTIDGKKFFRVPSPNIKDLCDGCYFWHHDECNVTISEDGSSDCLIINDEGDELVYVLMTEEALAAQSILKKEEKQRNID